MISRRNIRVKVMQTLYALEAIEKNPDPVIAKKLLEQNLEQTSQIFIYLLFFSTQVAQFAEIHAQSRAARHLPTAEDLTINTKIAANEIVLQLLGNAAFCEKIAAGKLEYMIDRDLIKKIYNQLAASEKYHSYISVSQRNPQQERKIMEYIFNDVLLKNELFDQHAEDNFLHWQDDKDMMRLLVNNYFHKPEQTNFQQLISPEKKDYAISLLQTSLDKKEYCLTLIKPKLQNWDSERIAAIDMIVMEMGLCEFLYFPTIPAKVTINEYIDLAKTYSTPQSGQFVNGILDNILKDLERENKIKKTERGQK